jgi:hypothetical protein
LGAGNEKAVGAKGPRWRRNRENGQKDGGQHTDQCLEYNSPSSTLAVGGRVINTRHGVSSALRNRSR